MPQTVRDRHPRIHRPRGRRPARMAGRPRHGADACGGAAAAAHEIQHIRALSQDDGALGYPVRIRGTVTHFDEQATHADHSRRRVRPVRRHAARGPGIGRDVARSPARRPGRDRGPDRARGLRAEHSADHVRKLGQEALPHPNGFRSASMLTGRHDCDYVGITGVIQRAWLSSDPQVTRCSPTSPSKTASSARPSGTTPPRTCTRLDRRPCEAARQHRHALRPYRAAARRLAVRRAHRATSPSSSRRPIRSGCPTGRSGASTTTRPAGEVNRRIRVRGVVTARIPGHAGRDERLHDARPVPLRRQRRST